jgi:uncharacterized protein YqgV (UPF0045/DUF77 family)
MTISAQVSIYPLRQAHLSPAVEAVREELEAHGLRPEMGAMSTQVVGTDDTVFAALRAAFIRVASEGQVVMSATFSNACPV